MSLPVVFEWREPGLSHCRLGPEACLLLGEGLKVHVQALQTGNDCRCPDGCRVDGLTHCTLVPEACLLLGEGLKVRLHAIICQSKPVNSLV
jgi:hypothetical protein